MFLKSASLICYTSAINCSFHTKIISLSFEIIYFRSILLPDKLIKSWFQRLKSRLMRRFRLHWLAENEVRQLAIFTKKKQKCCYNIFYTSFLAHHEPSFQHEWWKTSSNVNEICFNKKLNCSFKYYFKSMWSARMWNWPFNVAFFL